MNNKQPLIEMVNINKSFPSVQALQNVSIDILPGEVHALVGENGAGKSTLIKILMGVYSKDSGSINLQGKEIEIKSPNHAQSLGLGAVYQDVNLAPHLSIAENFFMGNLLRNKIGVIDKKSMEESAYQILNSIDVKVDPSQIVSKLSVAEQEMVVIGKIMHQNANVVIFDEPTALLTEGETEQLFKIIKKLRSENKAIIYISHRMEEIFRISDRVTVLKDGVKVDTVNTSDTNEDDLITKMVGRNIKNMYEISHQKSKETLLEVSQLSSKKYFEDISFKVQQGEIFGMFEIGRAHV